jgi:hypothetical protein
LGVPGGLPLVFMVPLNAIFIIYALAKTRWNF